MQVPTKRFTQHGRSSRVSCYTLQTSELHRFAPAGVMLVCCSEWITLVCCSEWITLVCMPVGTLHQGPCRSSTQGSPPTTMRPRGPGSLRQSRPRQLSTARSSSWRRAKRLRSVVRALHFPLSHSFSHKNLKSPCAEQLATTDTLYVPFLYGLAFDDPGHTLYRWGSHSLNSSIRVAHCW